MRQIASQTGVLLRRMRFVAGRSAAAEKLTGHGATAEVLTEVLQRRSCPAEALWQNVCWPGRLCWVSAGRGTMAKNHREDNAGRGATAKIHREESYLTNGVQLLLLCCIFAGKGQVAEEPAVSGKTAESRSTCSAWRYRCAHKCLQCLERPQGSESLWQRVVAHLFCVQQMNLEWEE